MHCSDLYMWLFLQNICLWLELYLATSCTLAVSLIARPLTVVVGHSSFTIPWSWSPDLSHTSAAMVSAVGNVQLLRLLLHCFSLPYLLFGFLRGIRLASICSRSDTVVSRMSTTNRSLNISSFRVPYLQLSIRPYRVVM